MRATWLVVAESGAPAIAQLMRQLEIFEAALGAAITTFTDWVDVC